MRTIGAIHFKDTRCIIHRTTLQTGERQDGVLTGYDNGAVSLTVGSETLRFEKPEIALVRLRCDF